ncbi:hypothetical protein GW901_01075 [Candidatus Parcubacteria bacterium]|nr:hypothetical protein [Candidatus Parcubacteria bacterium]
MKPHRDNILSKIFIFVKKDWFLILGELLLLSLVFTTGFIIGGKIITRPPLIIDKELIVNLDDNSTSSGQAINPSQTLFVASSRGKYYYPVDCSLAQNLSEKNKIYFSTKEEAEAKGYIYNTKCDN